MSVLSMISTILVFVTLFGSYRLFVGPTVYDRLISLNLVSVIVTIILIITSIDTGLGLYLDIAISFVMLNFVGTVTFAKYLEGGEFK